MTIKGDGEKPGLGTDIKSLWLVDQSSVRADQQKTCSYRGVACLCTGSEGLRVSEKINVGF